MTESSSFRFPLKHLLVGSFAAALAASPCYGFADVADGAIKFTTSATGTYDSYFIGTRKGGTDDYYLTLEPQVSYVRTAGLAQIDGNVGVAFNRYDKNSQYNSEDLLASFRSTLPIVEGARLSGSVDASYTEGRTVDLTVDDRVSTKTFTADFNAKYQLGLKMYLTEAFGYSNSVRTVYSDQRTLNNIFAYTYSDFLDGTSLSLTHQYTTTETSADNFLDVPLNQHSNSFSASLSRPIVGPLNGQASYGYSVINRGGQETSWNDSGRMAGATFSVGINGPFLPRSRFPKLESSISLAYQQSLSPGINDVGGKTLVGNFNLSWNARDRTKVFINGSRSTDLSINDLTVENSTVSTGINEDVGFGTHLNGSISYTWRKFRGVSRRDDTLTGTLSAQHTFNKYLNAGLTYEYDDNHLDAVGAQPAQFGVGNYHRNLVSLSLTATF